MMRDVIIFGPTPEPNGGVSSYIKDVSLLNDEYIASIVDIYRGRKLSSKGTIYRPTGGVALRIVKSFLYISKRAEKKLYLNFSTFRSLIISILFSISTKRIYITFHNGRIGNVSWLVRLFIFFLNRRSAKFVALSDVQVEILKGSGAKNIVKMDLYQDASIQPMEERLDIFVRKIKTKKEIIFMISGYPTQIYQHVQFIQSFLKWRSIGHDACLLCCLYGDDSDGILKDIRGLCAQNENIKLYEGLAQKEFKELLEASDVYVRSNTIDSYGIVVKEALECGKLVFASSVCRRTPGAYIFPSCRIEDVFCAIDSIFNGEPVNLPVSGLPDDFLMFSEVFK